MSKKILIAIFSIFAMSAIFISASFATNNMKDAANGVRNFVGGAENIVEDAVGGIATGIKDGVTDVKDATKNATSAKTSNGSNNNSNYTATRTSSNTISNTFLGMTPLALAWFTMAVLGIITVSLVWYYGKQHDPKYNRNDDNNY